MFNQSFHFKMTEKQCIFLVICSIILASFVKGNTYELNDAGLTGIPSDIPSDTINLILTSNQISAINTNRIQHLNALKQVDLTENLFTSFPDLCKVGSTLETLILKDNYDLATINSPLLSCLDVLTFLSLEFTGIDSFPDLSPIGATLAELHLNKNGLTGIPLDRLSPLTALWYLQLSDNDFGTIPDFEPLESTLGNLYLSNNGFTEVRDGVFDSLFRLNKLDLTKNQLTEYPNLCSLANTLSEIFIANNDIPEFDPEYVFCFTSFKKFSVGGRDVESVDNLDFTQTNETLNYLAIEDTLISSIPWWPNMGLVTIFSLKRNSDLPELPPDFFTGWNSLEMLNIESMDSWAAFPNFEDIHDTLVRLFASYIALAQSYWLISLSFVHFKCLISDLHHCHSYHQLVHTNLRPCM